MRGMNAVAASKAPPTEGAPASSRERMIEAAISLLRATGLTGAGINQVIAASGAPKGSMYHHFPGGKLELATVALTRWGERVAEGLAAQLAGPAPLPDKVRGIFEGTARTMAHARYARSCSVGAVSLDLDEETAALAPVGAGIFASWQAVLAAAMHGIPAPRRDALARFVISSIQGAQVQSRAARDNRYLFEAGAIVAALIAQALEESSHARENPADQPHPRRSRKSD
jgi:AcrR family transcriptional regulator